MKQATYKVLTALLVLFLSGQVLAQATLVPDSASEKKILIYTYAIKDNIAAPTWRTTQEALEEARALEADVVILQLNTYGGEVSAADSIRTKLLNAPMPVYVFI
jgi:membrane-bound serine protease (ClpP class)